MSSTSTSTSTAAPAMVDVRGPRFTAFLNAAFGICLGCQAYPLVARVRKSSSAPSPA
jgi:hypothetical protein